MGRSIVLTLQTLGVVFGDVGTSPLYTFDVMFNKYPITAKEDVLGALSLVIYTLILIPFLKYTLIVLWGNDDGEGTLFYMCQGARVNLAKIFFFLSFMFDIQFLIIWQVEHLLCIR